VKSTRQQADVTRHRYALGALWVVTIALTGCGEAPLAPRAEFDAATGRLRRMTVDLNRNGRYDAVSVMDGTRIDHVQLDLDENDRVERWDFYRPGPILDRVAFSARNDGVVDAQAFYGPAGALVRVEISTGRTGRFDRIEFYENGVLVRSEEDRDGDGRADKWETYRPNRTAAAGEPPYAVASVAFDDLGTGVPQRRLTYEEE
jgi:hypothetical protein